MVAAYQVLCCSNEANTASCDSYKNQKRLRRKEHRTNSRISVALVVFILLSQSELASANNPKYRRCRDVEFCGRYRSIMKNMLPEMYEPDWSPLPDFEILDLSTNENTRNVGWVQKQYQENVKDKLQDIHKFAEFPLFGYKFDKNLTKNTSSANQDSQIQNSTSSSSSNSSLGMNKIVNESEKSHQNSISSAKRNKPSVKIQYSVDPDSILFGGQYLNFSLQMRCGDALTSNHPSSSQAGKKNMLIAQDLQVSLSIYQEGILRVMLSDYSRPNFTNESQAKSNQSHSKNNHTEQVLKNVWKYKQRFGIADISGVGIEHQALDVVQDIKSVSAVLKDEGFLRMSIDSQDKENKYEYEVHYQPFRLIQKINGMETVIMNSLDSLYFDNYQFYQRDTQLSLDALQDQCLGQMVSEITLQDKSVYFSTVSNLYGEYYQSRGYFESIDFHQSFSVGFEFHQDATHLYGLGERVDSFVLNDTQGSNEPYRLQALDMFPHDSFARESTYSSIPYIHAHGKNFDANIIFLSAAEAWVDLHTIQKTDKEQRKHVQFLGESGRAEFILFGSASRSGINNPKRVQKLMADITGYQALPPFFSIGFHYCKWESATSARRMNEWNRKFSMAQIPVDVFWMDIPAMSLTEYFVLDPYKFEDMAVAEMKQRAQDKGRHFVVITDPHIKHNFEYDVFIEGMIQQSGSDKELNVITPSTYKDVINSKLYDRYKLQQRKEDEKKKLQMQKDQQQMKLKQGNTSESTNGSDLDLTNSSQEEKSTIKYQDNDNGYLGRGKGPDSPIDLNEGSSQEDFSDQLYEFSPSEDKRIHNIFIRTRDMVVFVGNCWPGNSVWFDFYNSVASDLWSSFYSFDFFKKTDDSFHIWLDMNEPSVFSGPEITLPKDAIHILDDGTLIKDKDVKNSYGYMMLKATYQGMIVRNQTEPKRPFILTRSAFFGTQKYGAKWTGDNFANFAGMTAQISQILTLSLSGISFVGADIPGFYEQASNDELYSQFYQLGGFFPFMRAHSTIDVQFREPYYQSPKVQRIVRETINLRYDLVHYLYTHFFIAHAKGLQIVRPLWFEHPEDSNTFGIQTQFMFGDDIMISPKLFKAPFASDYLRSPLGTIYYKIETYLPKDTIYYYWYDKSSYLKGAGRNITLFVRDDEYGVLVRGGSILPIKLHNREESLTKAQFKDINLEVYLDQNSKAKGSLYIDDGETFRNIKENERLYLNFEIQEDGYLYVQNMIQDSMYDLLGDLSIRNIIVFKPQKLLQRDETTILKEQSGKNMRNLESDSEESYQKRQETKEFKRQAQGLGAQKLQPQMKPGIFDTIPEQQSPSQMQASSTTKSTAATSQPVQIIQNPILPTIKQTVPSPTSLPSNDDQEQLDQDQYPQDLGKKDGQAQPYEQKVFFAEDNGQISFSQHFNKDMRPMYRSHYERVLSLKAKYIRNWEASQTARKQKLQRDPLAYSLPLSQRYDWDSRIDTVMGVVRTTAPPVTKEQPATTTPLPTQNTNLNQTDSINIGNYSISQSSQTIQPSYKDHASQGNKTQISYRPSHHHSEDLNAEGGNRLLYSSELSYLSDADQEDFDLQILEEEDEDESFEEELSCFSDEYEYDYLSDFDRRRFQSLYAGRECPSQDNQGTDLVQSKLRNGRRNMQTSFRNRKQAISSTPAADEALLQTQRLNQISEQPAAAPTQAQSLAQPTTPSPRRKKKATRSTSETTQATTSQDSVSSENISKPPPLNTESKQSIQTSQTQVPTTTVTQRPKAKKQNGYQNPQKESYKSRAKNASSQKSLKQILDELLLPIYTEEEYDESMFELWEFLVFKILSRYSDSDREVGVRSLGNQYYGNGFFQDMESEPRLSKEDLDQVINRESLIMKKYKSYQNTVVLEDVKIKVKDLFSNTKQKLIKVI